MTEQNNTGKTAIIFGVGFALSASLARKAADLGMNVVLAARNTDKLSALAAETKAETVACDVAERGDIVAAFERAEAAFSTPDLVIYNPSYRTRGGIVDLDPDEVQKTLQVTCFGGFLVAQEAARRMLARGHGTILLTGASASVKGYPGSAPFAMGKFALRGLAQSLARELHPKNIHVGHFVIDGGIRMGDDDTRADERGEDGMLHPDAIAEAYFQFYQQPRNAWAWELELRPWIERF